MSYTVAGPTFIKSKKIQKNIYFLKDENHDIAIAMSSSRADSDLCWATALAGSI